MSTSIPYTAQQLSATASAVAASDAAVSGDLRRRLVGPAEACDTWFGPLSRWRWVRAVVVILAGLTIGSVAMAEVPDWLSVRPFVNRPSASIDLVKLNIQGYRLEIPRNYLVTALRTNYVDDRNYVVIVMIAALPDLSGATPATLRDRTSILWAHPELIEIASRDYYAGTAEHYAQITARARSSVAAVDGDLMEVPDPAGSGRYLVNLGHPGEKDILASCRDLTSIVLDGTITRCRVRVEIAPGATFRYPGLGFLYDFDISKMSGIRTIDAKIRRLLNNFVKGVAE